MDSSDIGTAPASRSGRLARALRNEYLLAGVALLAMVMIFFSPVIRHNGTFSGVVGRQSTTYPWIDANDKPMAATHDYPDYVYPRQVFLEQSLRRDGQVPLWNPLTFGGSPFFAETGSRLAYPPFVVLSRLFEPTWAHDLYLMLHVFVAGMAAFSLMKQFGTRFSGALLTGVAWAFSSYALLYYVLEMYAVVAALLPLAVLFASRWHDRHSWSSLVLAGLTLGLLVLGTSVELALLSFLFVSAYAACLSLSCLVQEWKRLSPQSRVALVLAPGILAGIALTVAAVGLLPFLDLTGRSGRAVVEDGLPAVRAGDFLHAFVPPSTPLSFRGAISQQVFLGSIVAVLAIIGLFRRRPGRGLGIGLVVALFLFAIRSPFTSLAYEVLPPLRSLHGLGRALFLWDFGLAVLAGLGLDTLVTFVRGRIAEGVGRPSRRAVLAGAVSLACLAVTFGQLHSYGRSVSTFETRRPDQFLPPTPATESAQAAISRDDAPGRVLTLERDTGVPLVGATLPAATGMAQSLPIAGGYEPVLPKNVTGVWRVMSGEPVSSVLATGMPDTAVNARTVSSRVRVDLLPRLGIAAVLAPPGMVTEPGWEPATAATRGLRVTYSGPDGTVYEVVDPVPRAFVVTDAVRAPSDNEALVQFADPHFDFRRQVILDAPGDGGEGSPGSRTGSPAAVRWSADRPNHARLEVDAPEPGWLVMLDSWDPGWRARVNSKPARVQRADYGFRAVRIPAGQSVVSFEYRPTPVVVGAWISGTGAALAIGFCVALWLRQRRRKVDQDGYSAGDGHRERSDTRPSG